MSSVSKILLVEGQDDKHIIRHLREKFLPTVGFCIRETGNKEQLLAAISPEVKAHGRTVIGIVVDADDNVGSRWDAVSGRLQRAGIDDVPKSLCQYGTIINHTPRVGVWLMPDNRSRGEIENFVHTMIPESDAVWPRAKEYIRDIPDMQRKFSRNKISRAEIYAWLATRETPGRMGTAIRLGDLTADGELCASFLKWIENLFK